jgi:hypothetical protein
MEKRERPRTGQRNRCLRCDCGRLRFQMDLLAFCNLAVVKSRLENWEFSGSIEMLQKQKLLRFLYFLFVCDTYLKVRCDSDGP